jgi:hypothetical protein
MCGSKKPARPAVAVSPIGHDRRRRTGKALPYNSVTNALPVAWVTVTFHERSGPWTPAVYDASESPVKVNSKSVALGVTVTSFGTECT